MAVLYHCRSHNDSLWWSNCSVTGPGPGLTGELVVVGSVKFHHWLEFGQSQLASCSKNSLLCSLGWRLAPPATRPCHHHHLSSLLSPHHLRLSMPALHWRPKPPTTKINNISNCYYIQHFTASWRNPPPSYGLTISTLSDVISSNKRVFGIFLVI